MGLYVLNTNSMYLKQMPFEDILPEINEFVCFTLKQTRKPDQNLYKMISKEFNGQQLSFHIERLRHEFEQSHKEVA